jgi:hypothetical protein
LRYSRGFDDAVGKKKRKFPYFSINVPKKDFKRRIGDLCMGKWERQWERQLDDLLVSF